MADNFAFELVSPEKLLVSGDAEIVTIPGTEGDMGVLANHASIMTSLRPGFVGVKLADGNEESFFVAGGFADITQTSVTVLAEYAVPRADVTRELMDEQIKKAKDLHDSLEDPAQKANAHSYLEQLEHVGNNLASL